MPMHISVRPTRVLQLRIRTPGRTTLAFVILVRRHKKLSTSHTCSTSVLLNGIRGRDCGAGQTRTWNGPGANMRIRDAVAVITGAAGGIGRAVALELASRGAH